MLGQLTGLVIGALTGLVLVTGAIVAIVGWRRDKRAAALALGGFAAALVSWASTPIGVLAEFMAPDSGLTAVLGSGLATHLLATIFQAVGLSLVAAALCVLLGPAAVREDA